MTRRRRPLAAAAVATLFALGAAAHAAAPRDVLVTGFVRADGPQGAWTLRGCGARVSVALVDESPQKALSRAVGEVRRVMRNEARTRGVYVEFLGRADEKRAVARRFWRALGHVSSCARRPGNVPQDATLWASGHEPAWRFVATPHGVSLAVLGGETLAFAPADLRPAGAGVYEAQSAAAAIRVELVQELCSDTMAEAGYGATAVVTVKRNEETTTYRGCAARF